MDWIVIFAIGIFAILYFVSEELQWRSSKKKYEKERKKFHEAILRREDVDAPIWIKPNGATETNANDLMQTKKFKQTCQTMSKFFPQ